MIFPARRLRVPRGGKQTLAAAVRSPDRGTGRAPFVVWNPIWDAGAEHGRPSKRYALLAAGLDIAASAAARPSRVPTSMARQHWRGSQSLSASQRRVFAGERTDYVRREVATDHANGPFCRNGSNPDFFHVEIDQQTIAPQEFERQLSSFFGRSSSQRARPFINAKLRAALASGTNVNPPISCSTRGRSGVR